MGEQPGRPNIAEVLLAPDTSHWLKRALTTAVNRDPVDAARDAELLAKLLTERRDHLLGVPL